MTVFIYKPSRIKAPQLLVN